MSISATSTLHDGIWSYSPENAHDRKKDTVWAEGAHGDGTGERIIFLFDMRERQYSNRGLGVDGVSIINGFARTPALWSANSRVKRFRIWQNGRAAGEIELEDTPEPRTYDLPDFTFRNGKINELSFEILEVYPGSQHEDAVIADFSFTGYGEMH